ncbi:MAG: hypothetical protein VYE22_34430 [Myxococcota bacterium]|nr:hypothetical protein [Myxococcota bacterium]
MTRETGDVTRVDHGRTLMSGEPLVFHCNHYNYWLQKTLLLPEGLGMRAVIRDAASSAAHAMITQAARERGATEPAEILRIAADCFSALGFGTMDFSGAGEAGGAVRTPTSHYGQCLRMASGADFAEPQELFDQGYAAGALAAAHGRPAGSYAARSEASQSMGAEVGEIALAPREAPADFFTAPGRGPHAAGDVPPQSPDTNVDEGAVLSALAGLDLSGNEEGLLPRFGVILTNHFANFYDRISFEFVRRMDGTGMLDMAEELLVEAGYRCAFNTFGGIMTSAEWDAVVKPQCKTTEDWVHGMVAVANALGWGVWRVHELTPSRLVVRIWDDYESTGYLGMYGESDRFVSHLAAGGVAGLMNLVYPGRIAERPTLDAEYYARIFESPERFEPRGVKCMASGDAYTEVVAER